MTTKKSTTTPNVFFQLGFYPPEHAKYKFYTSKNGKSESNLDYIMRKEAIENTIDSNKYLSKVIERVCFDEKTYLGYADKRGGSTGLFGQEGSINEQGIKTIHKELFEYTGVLWSAVLSFSEEYAAEHEIFTKEKAMQILQATFYKFLKTTHLNADNVNWYAAFHTNTDNPHCHIFFYEKEPINLSKQNSKPHFTIKGKIGNSKKDVLSDYKLRVETYLLNHQETYQDLKNLRDIVLNTFKQSLTWQEVRENIATRKNDKHPITVAMIKLIQSMPKTGHLQYNRLKTSNLKPLIDTVTMQVINTDLSLKNEYEKYCAELMKNQKTLEQIYKNNNTKISNETLEFTKKRIEDLYSRIGNHILDTAKELKNTYEPNLQQEIGLKPQINIEKEFFDLINPDTKSNQKTINDKNIRNSTAILPALKPIFKTNISNNYMKKLNSYKYTKLLSQINKTLSDHKYDSIQTFKNMQQTILNELSHSRTIER